MDLNFDNAITYHYDKFPPGHLNYQEFVPQLLEATDAVARYDQMLKTMHNSEILLAPMRNQEAVISSRMEGTISTMDEILKYEADHGKFPDTLGELVEKGYASSIDHLQPTDGDNWIYFQGLTSKSSTYKYFIRSEHHKVVIYIDGTSGDRNLFYTAEPTDFPMRGHESVRE